jgi:LysR family glycine cleavage system transcriptional activator
MRRLPPLNALRAFEAAGRHLSFSKAAAELHVTPAAISQQVRALEDHLGVPLFRRLNRALLLTDAGQLGLPALSEGFDRLVDGIANIQNSEDTNVLAVSVAPSVTAKWLMPRLDRFYREHPEVDLRIDATSAVADFGADGIDVAIRYGPGNYPGMRVDVMMAEEVFPVCSPKLLEGDAPLRDVSDLGRFTLLHLAWVSQDESWPDWRMWLAAAGHPEIDSTRGPRFVQFGMSVEAAVKGLGVALGSTAVVSDDLATGRLVKPFDLTLAPPFKYYLVCPERNADRPIVAAFRDWILREALN